MAGNFSTLLWLKLFDELESKFGRSGLVLH